jgi:hypothetical protein
MMRVPNGDETHVGETGSCNAKSAPVAEGGGDALTAGETASSQRIVKMAASLDIPGADGTACSGSVADGHGTRQCNGGASGT